MEIYLFLAFALLQILDGVTTYIALQSSGSKEANPIMNFLFTKFGIVPSLVIFKAIVIGLIFYLHLVIPLFMWIIMFGFYVAVGINNSYQIYKMKKNG